MEINFQTLLAVFTTLGLGGVVGAWVQSILNKRGKIELKIQDIKEDRYRSILVWARCSLEPKSFKLFSLNDPNVERLVTEDDVEDYSKKKVYELYYNSLLYASDTVLLKMKYFINEPNKQTFFNMASSMRKDLWRKSNLDTKELIV